MPPIRLSVVCMLVSLCCSWQYGYQITCINVPIKLFYESFLKSLTDCDDGYMPSEDWLLLWRALSGSFFVGVVLGLLMVPLGVRCVGVKWTLALSTLPTLIGYAVASFTRISVAYKSTAGLSNQLILVDLLILGRFMAGLHGGAALALLPLLITECSPARHRGFLLAFQQVSHAVAILVGLIIRSHAAAFHFEMMQWTGALPSLILALTLTIIPNTPHYYITMRMWDKSELAIRFYYGGSADVDQSLMNVMQETINVVSTHTVHDEQHSSTGGDRYTLAAVLSPETDQDRLTRNGLLVGCLAAASSAFLGDHIIESFSETLGQDASDVVGDNVEIMFGVISVMTAFLGCWIVQYIGRRAPMICGLIGVSTAMIAAAVFTYIQGDYMSVGIVTSFALTKAFVGFGAGAPAWFLTSELVPPTARTLCQTISTMVLLSVSALVTVTHLPLVEAVGAGTCILLLSSIPGAIITTLLYIYLPETKGCTFHYIRHSLGQKSLKEWTRKRLRTLTDTSSSNEDEPLIQGFGGVKVKLDRALSDSYGGFSTEDRIKKTVIAEVHKRRESSRWTV